MEGGGGDFCFTMKGRSTFRAMIRARSPRGIGRKGQYEGSERPPLFSMDSRAWLFGEEIGDAQRMRHPGEHWHVLPPVQ